MANYYVTTPGNGGSDAADGSISTPWATLSHACSVVSGVGDVIHVAAGSYTDNTQAVLAVGVNISGAGKASTLISSSAAPYIVASTAVPAVDGSNEISGLGITGSGSNYLLRSQGRSNQLVHDNSFTNGSLLLEGETPRYISPADGTEEGTSISAAPNKLYTVEPATTDWATGCQIYNNTLTNTKFDVNTIKGALIHDNVIDNSGGTKSCWGNTSYFWHSAEFYNNEFHVSVNSASTIGIEVWHIAGDTKFYNNIIDGWASLLMNVYGDKIPWSMEIYDNDFSSNVTPSGIAAALECGYHLENVKIEGNYFANTGANVTYTRGIAIWGSGTQRNFHIQRNIFYTTDGAGIEINSTISTPGAIANPADIDDIYIYNNVFDTGGTNAIIIENTNATPATQDIDGIFVRNNYTNVSGNIVGFNPNPPTGSMSGNFLDHNQKSAAQSGYVQAPGSSVFTVADNVSGNGQFLATGDRWTNYYKPTPAGNLIDAGVNVGLPYSGAAPDIGAFEEPPTELSPTHTSAFRMF